MPNLATHSTYPTSFLSHLFIINRPIINFSLMNNLVIMFSILYSDFVFYLRLFVSIFNIFTCADIRVSSISYYFTCTYDVFWLGIYIIWVS